MTEPSVVEPAQRVPNNFDGLRVIGALMVLVGHGFELTGRTADVPMLWGFPIHVVGIYLFFAISGYLIAASWVRTRDLWTYATARLLRIFPALVLVVAVTVFVLGPIATTLPLGTYFASGHTYSYFDNARLEIRQFDLPGVFAHNTYPGAINGSLWSLPFEFTCYLAVPVALLVRNRWVSLAAVVAILAECVVLTTQRPESLPAVFGQSISLGVSFWACFAAGSVLFLLRQRWPGVIRLDVAVGLGVADAITTQLAPGEADSYTWIAVPYIVLAVGLASWPGFRDAGRFGDLSYGLYLWAFPIQQLVVWQWGDVPLIWDLPLVAALTAVCAYVSWHCLEIHALRLAKRMARPTADRLSA